MTFLARVLFISALIYFQPQPQTLQQARSSFHTKLLQHVSDSTPVPPPPPNLFQIVRYQSAVGMLPAYLTLPPKDHKKHPAIIWIHGGWPYDIDNLAWTKQPADNDQSGSAFWQSGIVELYPALRGAHENIGQQEGQYGEVDDVLAAAEFLAKQPFVDTTRIYLGGHSTGATLSLLAAEMGGTQFRAVFCFGPANDVLTYKKERLTFDTADPSEFQLRRPMKWLNGIKAPVLIFEGDKSGNIPDIKRMAQLTTNPLLHVHTLEGQTHFSILAPVTKQVAQAILTDAASSSPQFPDFDPGKM